MTRRSDAQTLIRFDAIHPWFQTLRERVHLITVPPTVSDEEFGDYFDAIRGIYPRISQKQAYVFDLRKMTARSITATQRRTYANFEREVEKLDREWTAGTAIIVRNGVQRGLVTALFWLKPPVYPYTVLRSKAEAIDWCVSCLEETDDAILTTC